MKKINTICSRLISLSILMLLCLGLYSANTNEVIYKVRQLREFLNLSPVSDGRVVTPLDSLAVIERKREIQAEIDALLASTREDYETQDITILGYIQDKGVLSLENNDLKKHMNIRMTQEQADTITRSPRSYYLIAKRELDQSLSWKYYNWTLKGNDISYYEDEVVTNSIPKLEPIVINPEALVEINRIVLSKDPEGQGAISKFDLGKYEESLNDLLSMSQTTRTQRPHYYFWIAMNYMNLGDIGNARYYYEKYLQSYDTNYAGFARSYLDLTERQQTIFRRVRITDFPDYLTDKSGEMHFAVTPDGNYLYYSSNRPAPFAGTNIWRAERLNSNWGYPELVPSLCTDKDDAICSFSTNGLRAFLMGHYEKDKADTDIYYSDFDQTWQIPAPIGKVNSPSEDIDPYVYQDRLMFLSSNRAGGYGGYDLYLSINREGAWQEPVNLGSAVNSAGDETAPFMDWDGKTLFFASNGYSGFGGTDVYKAVVLNAEGSLWSRAENVGAPLNSFQNDIGFYHIKNSNDALLLTDRGRSGVFSMHPLSLEYAPRSYYTVDNAGNMLFIRDTDSTSPLSGLLKTLDAPQKYIELYGNCYNEKQEPVSAEISFAYVLDGIRYTENLRSDKSGYYSIQLPSSHKYTIETGPAGYSRYSLEILPRIDQTRVRHDISLSALAIDKVFVFSNIIFEYDSAVLTAESYPVLNEIALTLLGNPSIRVEISGHTCENQGGEKYNDTLSRKRAEAVVAYLTAKGVKANRMTSKGYGMSRPLNDNQSEEEKTQNRRVEVKIIK